MTSATLQGLAGLYGLCAVGLGAFAAHGLKARLDDYALDIMNTATQYAMVHAVALLALSCAPAASQVRLAGWGFALGVALFSGSLYALALSGQRWLGAITPLGGLFLLAAWGYLLFSAFRHP